ncbi:MAG: flagellar protein FlgN [Gammaproteobacteria bacterium]|nr:flagellar protein FlgN [Gammaproteobacteria bacterium]
MTSTNPVIQLKQLLEQDLVTLSQLQATLADERKALDSRDTAVLQKITHDKDALLNQLRERARSKVCTLVNIGYRPEKGHPGDFIRASGVRPLIDLWEQAERGLRDVQFQNEVNGRVIGHLQRRLARLADIMRGKAQQPKLYGAQGQERSVGHTSVLASA